MRKVTSSEVIKSLSPNSEFIIYGDEYSDIKWLSGQIISEEQFYLKKNELELDFDKKEYQRQRAPEYPSITDQLDALFHAGVFPPEMAEQIQAVKDKYPKPE